MVKASKAMYFQEARLRRGRRTLCPFLEALRGALYDPKWVLLSSSYTSSAASLQFFLFSMNQPDLWLLMEKTTRNGVVLSSQVKKTFFWVTFKEKKITLFWVSNLKIYIYNSKQRGFNWSPKQCHFQFRGYFKPLPPFQIRFFFVFNQKKKPLNPPSP